MNKFIQGFSCAASGFSWILQPKIRRFVYIPLIINILVFALAFGVLGKYLPQWVAGLLGEKSEWWGIVRWLYDILIPVLTVLVYIAMSLVTYFAFSSIANLIAAPFNAQLAKAVEQRLANHPITYEEIPLAKEALITIKSELAKLWRFAWLAAILLLLLFIPAVNAFFPLIWFVFMAYSLSIQYADYPMANHQLFYREQRTILAQHKRQRLGFGVAANLLLLIPVLNFFAMPVCVCGATIWWHRHIRKSAEQLAPTLRD